jgi:hypothetical protein
MLEFVGLCDCHDGARKSKNNCWCDCTPDVLKLRTAAVGAHALCRLYGEGNALRHLLETFIVVIIIGVVGIGGCVSKGACSLDDGSPLGLVMRLRPAGPFDSADHCPFGTPDGM